MALNVTLAEEEDWLVQGEGADVVVQLLGGIQCSAIVC